MKRLVVSLHDVAPQHFDVLRRMDGLLQASGIGARYSMLVVPHFWRRWPLAESPELAPWLVERQADGVEMVLHGQTHRDEVAHRGLAARFAARHLTAGEGEFLGLSACEAAERLRAGAAVLERVLGRAPSGFVAPAWLYGPGARRALAAEGFRWAEDHFRVWSPVDGRVLARGPVISYASRTRGRIASSVIWSRVAQRLLSPLPVVRLAIHPGDLEAPVLAREIERTLGLLLRDRVPVRYSEL